MRRYFRASLLLTMVALLPSMAPAAVPAKEAAKKELAKEKPMALKIGDIAPNFTMEHFDGTDVKKVSLLDYRGKKNVVLAFYIFAFTGG